MSVLDLASVNTSNVQEMYPTPSIWRGTRCHISKWFNNNFHKKSGTFRWKRRLYFRAKKITLFTPVFLGDTIWSHHLVRIIWPRGGKLSLPTPHPHPQSLRYNQAKMQEILETWQEYETSGKAFENVYNKVQLFKSLQMSGFIMLKIVKKCNWLCLTVYKMSQKCSNFTFWRVNGSILSLIQFCGFVVEVIC